MKKLLFLVNSADFFLSHRSAVAVAAREAGYEVHVATPVSYTHLDVYKRQLLWLSIGHA